MTGFKRNSMWTNPTSAVQNKCLLILFNDKYNAINNNYKILKQGGIHYKGDFFNFKEYRKIELRIREL